MGRIPTKLATSLAILLLAVVLPAWSAVPASVSAFYVAHGDQPGEPADLATWQSLPAALQLSSIPLQTIGDWQTPADPVLPDQAPYHIDPTLTVADAATVGRIAEGLRLSLTGRREYAWLAQRFGPGGAGGSVTLTLTSLGTAGERAVTIGTPPAYVVELNRDLLGTFGERAMVPKLAHELIHVRDYDHGLSRCVAMEVSGFAADAAVSYESNVAALGQPIGPYTRLSSLRPVYDLYYVAFRHRPTPALHARYWRELLTLVAYERSYRTTYRDAQGGVAWNSPSGPITAQTYVPYDPAYAWP